MLDITKQSVILLELWSSFGGNVYIIIAIGCLVLNVVWKRDVYKDSCAL